MVTTRKAMCFSCESILAKSSEVGQSGHPYAMAARPP